MKNLTTSCAELETINKLVFNCCGFEFSNLEVENESQDYFAHCFMLNKQNVKFRVAKITAKKIGQFVTIWKRNKNGITEPHHMLDKYDFYLIATTKSDNFGLFVFPKMVLVENKILTSKTNEGKRGIRVYPPWDLTNNKQAQKTQLWQSKYFLDLSVGKPVDINLARQLFGI